MDFEIRHRIYEYPGGASLHLSSSSSSSSSFLFTHQMGGIIAFLKIYLEGETINVFTIGDNGRKMPWLRYVGWLITCPVLLIHLGNLTGEANFNIMRLMKMLVGLQLMVVSASTATVVETSLRWFFYFTGWCSMLLVFFQAFDVFFEAQNIFPEKAGEDVSALVILSNKIEGGAGPGGWL